MKTLLLVLLAATLFSGCKKDKVEDYLPPATQIGANTFGCKINDRVFVPKGNDGTGRPNPHIIYDYDLQMQPYLTIDAIKFENSEIKGDVFIGFGNLTSINYYSVPINFTFLVTSDIIGSCGTVAFDTTIQKWGGGYITKLDIPNRIISGTFDFKYKTLNCDTVFITDGRFDIRF